LDPQVFKGSLHTKFEQEYGFGDTAGIDEAGCGPWAGPVVAAAVILFPAFLSLPFVTLIDDSKRLSPEKRGKIVKEIESLKRIPSSKNLPLLWGIGQASSQEIDALNIRQANFLAMKRALEALPHIPKTILLDGTGGLQVEESTVVPLVKGDQQSLSIATASLLAKVTRDRLMEQLATIYPMYSWEKNKGYGTRLHQEALQRHGPSPYHRISFKPVKACCN
jgi:ribonuclease HII